MSLSPSFLPAFFLSRVPASCIISLPLFFYVVLSPCFGSALGCMRCLSSFICFRFIVDVLGQFTLLLVSLTRRDNLPVFSSLSRLVSPVRPFFTHPLFAKMCYTCNKISNRKKINNTNELM